MNKKATKVLDNLAPIEESKRHTKVGGIPVTEHHKGTVLTDEDLGWKPVPTADPDGVPR